MAARRNTGADVEATGGSKRRPSRARRAPVAPPRPVHYLQRLAERLPLDPALDAPAEYLAALDRHVVERATSRRDSDRLAALAAGLGIERAQAAALNRGWFDALLRAAVEQGPLRAGERAELATVAALLRIEPAVFERLTAEPIGTPLTV